VLSWFVAVSGSYVMNSSIIFATEFGRLARRWRVSVGARRERQRSQVIASYWNPILVAKLLAS
jgi:hypothetical protein